MAATDGRWANQWELRNQWEKIRQICTDWKIHQKKTIGAQFTQIDNAEHSNPKAKVESGKVIQKSAASYSRVNSFDFEH